jgi:hypothetical protein
MERNFIIGGREMGRSKLFYFVLLLAAVSTLAMMPFAETASASVRNSYMPDPTKIFKYRFYEGSSRQEFSHVQDGMYIWNGVYSYDTDQPFTKFYKESKAGLIEGNLTYGYSFMYLAYPLKVGTTWSYKNQQGKNIICKITSVTKTIKTKAGTFKNVVEVRESDGTYRYYAKNVGLIKKYQPHLPPHIDEKVTELVSIQPKIKVMWGKAELKKGQIGRITVQKPINLWKRDKDHRLQFVRILKPGEQYRVYRYDNRYGGQYSVGKGYYVTNIPSHIKYETPSKQLLEKVRTLYSN